MNTPDPSPPRRRFASAVALMLTLVLLSGCGGTRHVKKYEPKQRDYQFPVKEEAVEHETAEGSLWAQSNDANYMYTDRRAIRPGDILTVKIEEFATAQRATGTSTSRDTQMNADVTAFLGLMAKLQELDPDINPTELISAGSSLSFDHSGETERSEKLMATVPVIVKQSLPNGNVFVEGHRVILVNEEEHHFYISGVARPHDVDEANSISSTLLADAEIEFTGRGVLSDGQKPGALQRIWGWIWPF